MAIFSVFFSILAHSAIPLLLTNSMLARVAASQLKQEMASSSPWRLGLRELTGDIAGDKAGDMAGQQAGERAG